ncbi:MAG: fused MFS/spermidine synthase, partial [Myxococcales bacterium]|nr:fused MFS/spermidine synthase [Myxococcales bacterium]
MTRFLALAVTGLTGFTGLVYQVTWQKYLATLLGSHAEATAAVLGLFLGGMSVGYALFGVVTENLAERARSRGGSARLLTVYGLVEAGIGAWALLFPWLFAAAQRLALALPHPTPGVGFGVDVFLSLLLIGPPTVLMGGTIPFLTQALARSLEDATRLHAFVYAFNTAGAFVGALAAGFILVHWLGLDGVLLAMGVVNLAAGASFVLLDRRSGSGSMLAGRPEARRVEGFAGYATVALLVGFAMMTLETVLIRVGALSFGSSEFTFAMVVACFVLCIALGSFAVSAFPSIPRWLLVVNQCALGALLLVLYFLLPKAPYAAHVVRVLFTRVDAAFYPFYLESFLGMLAVLVLPILLSGATLPLLFDHLRHEVGDLGAVAGRIYAWNTVGSLLGALLGGYVLLFWLGLHDIYRVAVAAVLLGAVILGVLMFRVTRVAAAALVVVPLAVVLVAAPAWNPHHLSMGAFRVRNVLPYSFDGHASFIKHWWTEKTHILFYRDDPTMSVAVLETDLAGQRVRSVMVNGKPDSATVGDSATQGLLGVLPALFAQTPRHAFVIGYGTGITVGALAALDTVESVEVAEISAGVIEAAPLFDFANDDTSKNPKVEILRSDAYRALLRSREQFDVIVSAPSNPWVTGVEMLYSREFLETARIHLTPGGVYAQWFQQYETQASSVALVLRTYASVFDHVSVWYGSGSDLLLLGFEDADHALDVERLERRAARPDFARVLQRAELTSFPALLAHELLPLGVLHAAQLTGPVHTLYRPLLNYGAARAYFLGDIGPL